jgi:small subunit ribosomal protein S17e
VNRIKRLSFEVLDEHKSEFGEDFADNKKALNQISIIRSKSLKNEVTGYITRLIKKENREEKIKQDRRLASQPEEQEVQVETSETTTEETAETITISNETPSEVATEAASVDKTPESTEEKTE